MGNLLIGGIVAICFFLALFHIHKMRKEKRKCDGNCGNCSGC